MATIPIEIVLQDPNNPIVPDTSGDDPGENTNILVPDTSTGAGYTTKDGNGINSIFGGSNATVSIVSIVVLVLTLGAIIALLIRKYQKHKKGIEAHASRREKLATAATGTLAALAAVTLVGNLVIPATKATSDDANSTNTINTTDEGELVLDDKITITVTREENSDEAIVSSIENKSYATVYKTFGYEVAISMAEGLDSANLYLDGDKESEYYISPVEDGALIDNTWGYTLDKEIEEYNAMPLADSLAVVAKGTTPVSEEEVDIYCSVKVSSDMPNGTYIGELEYTLADTGFPAALRTMQDMTTDICSSVPTPNPFKADNTTIEDNVPTIMLKDVRDNKLYRVAKLADSKCWMTQNLDLQKEDLLDGVVLDDSNTDNPATGFELPDSQTSGSGSWGNPSSKVDIETLHVYDVTASGTHYYCSELTPWGGCNAYSDEEIPMDELGNYYNYVTATGGTGTYEVSNGSMATGSICPTGWKLPAGATSSTVPTDYSILLSAYGVLSNPTEENFDRAKIPTLFNEPVRLIRSGTSDRMNDNIGATGAIWSSVANTNIYANFFTFNVKNVSPWYYSHKVEGCSVRCVAQ